MSNEEQQLAELLNSLHIWTVKSHNKVIHKPFEKHTCSLYRFGWFYINDYEYSISEWRFRNGIIKFFTEETGDYITFNINTSEVIGNSFVKDSWPLYISKKIRINIVKVLRKLIDKLQH